MFLGVLNRKFKVVIVEAGIKLPLDLPRGSWGGTGSWGVHAPGVPAPIHPPSSVPSELIHRLQF